MNTLRLLAAAAVLAVSAHGAFAATFDFTDTLRRSSSSFTMSGEDGLTLTVSGAAHGGAAKTVRTSVGFGLSVGPLFVDNGEFAIFDFDRKVSLTSFVAGFVDKFDTYRAFVRNGDTFDLIASGNFGVTNAVGGNKDRATVVFGDAVRAIEGYSFAIGVGDDGSAVKLRGLSVDPVSQVPVPAAGVMLLSALGLVALKRRKA